MPDIASIETFVNLQFLDFLQFTVLNDNHRYILFILAELNFLSKVEARYIFFVLLCIIDQV